MRNSKIIDDVFEQIREQQGGGLLNIEEIVTSFIKSEEQNRGLLNYEIRLNQEEDYFEERNRDIDNQIVTFNSLVTLSEDDKRNKLEAMR